MTDQTHIDSVFFSTFIGNMVLITSIVSQTHRVHLPDGSSTETLPMFFEGILMDLDDENYYVGDGHNVSSSIRKEHVLSIELKPEEDELKQLLESAVPRNETDFN